MRAPITMKQKNIACVIVITVLALTTFLTPAYAGGPKPLSKSEAAQLLALMGNENVVIGAIIQPAATAIGSGQSSVTVLAIGRMNGKIKKIAQTFFYDADIGWFDYEYDGGNDAFGRRPTTKLRMWTQSGYKEILPK